MQPRSPAQPRLYLSGARPPRTGQRGHLAVAADTAAGGGAARGGRRGAALGVPESRSNFFPRSPTFGGRRSGTGRRDRSSWKEQQQQQPHSMASSASSSPAGAEDSAPAQVSAAPPPTCGCLHPGARGHPGGREARAGGGQEPWRLPRVLPSWGCQAVPRGSWRASGGDPVPADRGGQVAPGNCDPGKKARARTRFQCWSIPRREGGPRTWGFCLETFV